MKEKPGIEPDSLPTYGNYIKDRKRYNKHAAKVKEYAQPYKSSFEDTDDKPENNSGKPQDSMADASDSSYESVYSPDSHSEKPLHGKTTEAKTAPTDDKPSEKNASPLTQNKNKQPLKNPADNPKLQGEPQAKLNTEGSRWSKVKNDADGIKSGVVDGSADNHGNIDSLPKNKTALRKTATENKLKADKPKLGEGQVSKLETDVKTKLTDTPIDSSENQAATPTAPHGKRVQKPTVPQESDTPVTPSSKLTEKPIDSPGSKLTPVPIGEEVGNENKTSTQHKQIMFNRKKQYAAEHDTQGLRQSPKQQKLQDKADKLTEKGSKLREKQEKAIADMPTETVKHTEYIYDEQTGKPVKTTTTDTHTLHQNEARWNNPKFTQKLKNAKGVKGKAKVIGKEAVKKGAVIGITGAVGGAPAVAGAAIAKPTLTYGSKLIVDSVHRQVRKDIQKSDNEVLQAAHWAEQKGERAVVQGISKLSPTAIHRHIKNAPYRKESKLKKRELKNDKKLGLLRVKQDKASGVNHMTGKKSNAVSRAWQKRQIKKNYQKAMQAANGKGGGGTFGAMARELARGNPKGIMLILARKATLAFAKFVAKITILNPLFWKLMLIVLLLIIIMASVQACVAMFSPAMAGIGFVSDEDINFSTEAYSEWEVDMRLYLESVNIEAEYPPPAHITAQPGVNGEVVYPDPPYTPPPPFYEYRFEIGMISHDPMELISYLTVAHGERFDEDSNNPLTRSGLEAILAEIFEAQYGIAPGDFDNLIREEVETRHRIERRWEEVGTQPVITGYDIDGLPIWGTEPVFDYVNHDVYYEFWILTISLEPKSLSEVLRSRMTADEEAHFDILNLTGNGRQIVGNPFDFNWLPFISSHYGYRINPTASGKQLHMGIDIAVPLGTPIYATHTGTIAQVQTSDTGYGNMIRLKGEGLDGSEVEAVFAHLHEILVTDGQEVTQGDLIGKVGSTGDSTGPHLHLEVIRQNPSMHLNPIFAVVTWTDEEGNDSFRPLPGTSGLTQYKPPFIPDIPPEAMSDARFVALLTEASRHLGAKYVWGASGPTTFDCSGFIHHVFTTALADWNHGRTTAQGYFNMSTPVSAENAKPGDLVFFTGTHSGAFITHVGIYIGNGQMIHTGGNPSGVEFVNLNSPFWQKHFYSFARV